MSHAQAGCVGTCECVLGYSMVEGGIIVALLVASGFIFVVCHCST